MLFKYNTVKEEETVLFMLANSTCNSTNKSKYQSHIINFNLNLFYRNEMILGINLKQ